MEPVSSRADPPEAASVVDSAATAGELGATRYTAYPSFDDCVHRVPLGFTVPKSPWAGSTPPPILRRV